MNKFRAMRRRQVLSAALSLVTLLGVGSVAGAPQAKPPAGRPIVKLDRLSLPDGLAQRAQLETRLRATLKREARRANWGAGRENHIEYRFSLQALEISQHGSVLRVRCAALGELPGGEKAKSDVTFGGAPSERTALVHRVVDVVARGVVSRLAELERTRRGLH
ncbi:MAG TPA: hypothetical protein VLC09_09105 [Polyangiaceae bacterium]|nr:hypothetical protein [Polyangiaceae bacterium]